MTSLVDHAMAALDAMPAPNPKKKPVAKKAQPAKAPTRPKKPSAKKRTSKINPALAVEPHPDVKAITDQIDASKKRLADRPKPAPAKKAGKRKPQAPKPNSYKMMAQHATGSSAIEHPVKAMWDLCDKMQKEPRKKVIERAVEMGISYYTARTQYQLWRTAFLVS